MTDTKSSKMVTIIIMRIMLADETYDGVIDLSDDDDTVDTD